MTTEAREREASVLKALSQGSENALETAQQASRRGLKYEGASVFQWQVNPERETLVLANVEGLLDSDIFASAAV